MNSNTQKSSVGKYQLAIEFFGRPKVYCWRCKVGGPDGNYVYCCSFKHLSTKKALKHGKKRARKLAKTKLKSEGKNIREDYEVYL